MIIHKPYSYKTKSNTVIVFIHGIQGSPNQFNYMIEALDNNYSIENLLLPGHGNTAREFSKASMKEWQNHVDERIAVLEQKYENIIIVGHSMGGLLAVQTALTHPNKIKGLFLLAMPLALQMRFRFIKSSIIIGFTKRNDNEIIIAARKSNSISTKSAFEYLACTPRYIELINKSNATRKLIEELKIPITIIQSSDDEIVSRRSLRYVENLKNVKTLIAENSGHYYYPKESQEFIINEFLGFLEGIITK